jgi:hypothetical protein
VLEHYSGLERTRADARRDKRLPQRPLSASERAGLIAFLDSLTDESFVRRFAPAPPIGQEAAIASRSRSR